MRRARRSAPMVRVARTEARGRTMVRLREGMSDSEPVA
jgi:hypothetical protein